MNVIFCDKKTGNESRCSSIATYSSMLISKLGKEHIHNRCEKHKHTATQSMKCVSFIPLDQSEEFKMVQSKLKLLIGTKIFSSFHRLKYPILVKYVKDCGVMCLSDKGKWLYVYCHQINNF